MKILRRIAAALLALLIVAARVAVVAQAARRCCASARTTPPRSSAPMCFSPDAILTRCCASMCRRPASRFSSSCGSSVDREHGVVRAGFLGVIGDGLAQYAAGQGLHRAAGRQARSLPCRRNSVPCRRTWTAGIAAGLTAPFPRRRPGRTAPPSRPGKPIDALIEDPVLAGPGARAIVVVDHGRIVGEYYATGLQPDTPLLGWSMTKTVMAGVIGMLVKDGKLSLDQAGFWPGRRRARAHSPQDLLAMSSGLQWNEAYGAVSDVTSMLYLQPDMAGFARARNPWRIPPARTGVYSSGTARHSVAHRAGCSGAAHRRRTSRLHQSSAVQSAWGLPPRPSSRTNTAPWWALLICMPPRATGRRYAHVPAARWSLAGRRIAPSGLCHHDGHAGGGIRAASTAWAKPGCGDRTR